MVGREAGDVEDLWRITTEQQIYIVVLAGADQFPAKLYKPVDLGGIVMRIGLQVLLLSIH